jgi:uncharacterized membrane protein YphA (DoxX/SURF4 family)
MDNVVYSWTTLCTHGLCPAGSNTYVVNEGAVARMLLRGHDSDRMIGLSVCASNVVSTVVRFGLAVMWLVSGSIKAANFPQTYLAVQAYQVLPADTVTIVAAVLPWIEISLGLLLLVGMGTHLVAWLSGLLLLAFIAGVSQAWIRGLTIDCGCFGGGGQVSADQTAYALELARDIGFLLLAGLLLARPSSYLGVDRALMMRQPTAVGRTQEQET